MAQITTKRAAIILESTERWIRSLLQRNKIRGEKLGRDWLVDEASVYEYIESRATHSKGKGNEKEKTI